MTYRLFIVEDHAKMRETYSLFVAVTPELEICGFAATAPEALTEIPRQSPDLVIIDLSLPDIDGLELTRQLRARHPALPILIVSGHHASDCANIAAQAGASGYIDKQTADSTLIPTIHEILGGS